MHFKGLDLNLLVILDALLEEQSVTRAAQRVHVSQPAVSAALAKLRQHTGDELLEKVGRDFRLTPRAQTMVKPVKEILLQIESTIYAVSDFDPTQADRIFNIAMSSYSAEILTPGLVQRLTASYPGIACVVEEISSETLARLNAGTIDCCITFQQTRLIDPSETNEELCDTHLFSDRWLLVAAADNESVVEDLSYDEFCQLPYIGTRMARNLPSFADRTLDHKNKRPKPNLVVPSFELALTGVINSDCVSVVPALLVDEHLRPFLKMQNPPFEMPALEEFLVWHSRSNADQAHRWFRGLVLEVARDLQLQEKPHPDD